MFDIRDERRYPLGKVYNLIKLKYKMTRRRRYRDFCQSNFGRC